MWLLAVRGLKKLWEWLFPPLPDFYKKQENRGKWYVLQCKCRICNYQWIGVIEEEEGAEADFRRLECNRCGGRNSDWFDIYGKGETK
jgi:hypothetical protein